MGAVGREVAVVSGPVTGTRPTTAVDEVPGAVVKPMLGTVTEVLMVTVVLELGTVEPLLSVQGTTAVVEMTTVVTGPGRVTVVETVGRVM